MTRHARICARFSAIFFLLICARSWAPVVEVAPHPHTDVSDYRDPVTGGPINGVEEMLRRESESRIADIKFKAAIEKRAARENYSRTHVPFTFVRFTASPTLTDLLDGTPLDRPFPEFTDSPVPRAKRTTLSSDFPWLNSSPTFSISAVDSDILSKPSAPTGFPRSFYSALIHHKNRKISFSPVYYNVTNSVAALDEPGSRDSFEKRDILVLSGDYTEDDESWFQQHGNSVVVLSNRSPKTTSAELTDAVDLLKAPFPIERAVILNALPQEKSTTKSLIELTRMGVRKNSALWAGVREDEPYFDGYRQNHRWDYAGFPGWTIFALITSVIIFPAVYRKIVDATAPIIIQLAPIFASGLGWESLIGTALSAAKGS